MITRSLAILDHYVVQQTKQNDEYKNIYYPSCIIEDTGVNITSKRPIAIIAENDDKTNIKYTCGENVIIEYDENGIENFTIIEHAETKKLTLYAILTLIGVLILWLFVSKFGIGPMPTPIA